LPRFEESKAVLDEVFMACGFVGLLGVEAAKKLTIWHLLEENWSPFCKEILYVQDIHHCSLSQLVSRRCSMSWMRVVSSGRKVSCFGYEFYSRTIFYHRTMLWWPYDGARVLVTEKGFIHRCSISGFIFGVEYKKCSEWWPASVVADTCSVICTACASLGVIH
jgi:hypothetical protein